MNPMIAIHSAKGSFSDRWISYCIQMGIKYKIVDCYQNDIIEQLDGCDALMWHFNHMNYKDNLFAKTLHFSIEQAGIIAFPNFNTAWHFDDKLGQKYLLEVINAPLVPTWVFYSKSEALKWAEQTTYPKVFKLRKGAGSSNVKLAKSYNEAKALIKKAFGKGFAQSDALATLKERWRNYKLGRSNYFDIVKGLIRFLYPTDFVKNAGKEKGYIYFQEFIPNNDHDIRVIVIDNKAFAIKRMTRENDFRASGSGNIVYNKEVFDEKTIQLAFDLSNKINGQSIAFDFIFDNGVAKVVEISYGFLKEVYDKCEGYWDREMNWHQGKFDFCGWMVEAVIKKIKSNEK